jgi:uncharacterized coiled-coil DUF342 family protein
MITVGDQIFALNQEVKQLKKQCQQYQEALQEIINESTGHPTDAQKCASLAQSALTQFYPVKGTA